MDINQVDKMRNLIGKLLELKLITTKDISNGIEYEELKKIYSNHKEESKKIQEEELFSKKGLKRGKPNNENLLSLDELNIFSCTKEEAKKSPEKSLLEKLEMKEEYQKHGLAMSTLIGFSGEKQPNKGLTLEQSFGRRIVPIRCLEQEEKEKVNEFEEKEKKSTKDEEEDFNFDELDAFVKQYHQEEEEKLQNVEEKKMVLENEGKEKEKDVHIEAPHPEQFLDIDDMMQIEAPVEEPPTPVQNIEHELNFKKIQEKISLCYKKLKPDFSSKYEIIEKEHKDEDGDLIEGVEFYWYDMALSFSNPERKYVLDTLHIFGKMQVLNKGKKEEVSACLTVKNTEMVVYVVKIKRANFSKFEKEVKEKLNRVKFKDEIKITRKKKRYCFDLEIASGEVECLELRYPYKLGKLKIPFKGLHYNGVFGTSFNPIQSTLLEKGMKGPSWILIQDYKMSPKNKGFSWCKVDLEIDSPEDFDLLPDFKQKFIPELKLVALNLTKTVERNSRYCEIEAVSLLEFNLGGERKLKNDQHPYFFIVDSNQIFSKNPKKLLELKKKFKIGNSETQILICNSEAHLLRLLIQKISIIDPDGYIGHDLVSSSLDLLVDRLKIRNITFSDKISRIKKSQAVMKFWTNSKGDKKIRNLTHGRLVIDSFTLTSELLKEREYNLKYLSEKYLKEELNELNYETRNKKKLNSTEKILDFLLTENFLSMKLVEKLKLIELTEQLTKASGCLWDTSIRSQKLNRNEMLIMHEFNSQNYILPDFYPFTAGKSRKKKIKNDTYQGGLVYEPRKGLYTNIVLMLDFNSLYPSIIREFKICFSTVKRKKVKIGFYLNRDEYEMDYIDIDLLEKDHNPGKIRDNEDHISLLPKIVKRLVNDRKGIKSEMKKLEKGEESERYRFLDTKQKAYKLISNSIYGSLGSPFSRFYSKSLAELVTFYGRNLLESCGKIVVDLGCDIVYGDTDSIFVDTKTEKLDKAMEIGFEIQKRINRKSKSKILEISIDSVYKKLLLNNKKRYAGLCITNSEEIIKNKKSEIEPKFKIEIKGMDVIRREWCDLSKDIGNQLLNLILSDTPEYQKKVYSILSEISSTLSNPEKTKKIPLTQLLIHQRINKDLKLYSGNTIPFINVARRFQIRENLKGKQLIGKVIPYLICKGKSLSTPVYDRAYHPDEYSESLDKEEPLRIDGEWYLSSQIAKPVMRILTNVKQISKNKVSEILGLENLFKQKNISEGVKYGEGGSTVEDYSAFYDQYSSKYRIMEWKSKDKIGKIERNFLTFSKIKSEDFLDIDPGFFKSSIYALIGRIVKGYYEGISNSCENCDFDDLSFSLVEENNESCEDCEGDLVFNKSGRDLNGNVYYIEEILKKILTLEKIGKELKEVVECDILPMIQNLRDSGRYEKMSLGAFFGKIVRGRKRVVKNRHYRILNGLIN